MVLQPITVRPSYPPRQLAALADAGNKKDEREREGDRDRSRGREGEGEGAREESKCHARRQRQEDEGRQSTGKGCGRSKEDMRPGMLAIASRKYSLASVDEVWSVCGECSAVFSSSTFL